MGYESRVIIAQKSILNRDSENPYIFSIELAQMDLCKMWNGFTELFDKEVDWKIYSPYVCDKCGDDIEITVDCYGDTCTYTNDIQKVINWLEEREQEEHYRRITPLIAMLKAYKAEKWESELILIHYGY